MLKILVALAIGLFAQAAMAEDPATDDKTEKEKKDEQFKPPPGFKTKKRGDLVLYCQTDATVGTRFKTEKCYNEEQLRTYILVLEAQRRDVDRIRTNCGGGPCTPYEPAMPR